jgi:hypothetical protein
MRTSWAAAALTAALGWAAPAVGQSAVGKSAGEFPPGQFSDGKQYRMSDYLGKVVVLYFYEEG